jgi:hypothetical protein
MTSVFAKVPGWAMPHVLLTIGRFFAGCQEFPMAAGRRAVRRYRLTAEVVRGVERFLERLRGA